MSHIAEKRPCIEPGALERFLAGQLSGEALRAADAHVDTCTSCQARLMALAKQLASQPLSSAPERLARGDAVGRYLVLDPLGSGAMGHVYLAYDPELDRRVALKLLRSRQVTQSERSGRLVREAQVLARLTHPNIVSVHDVGTAPSGDVFLAMEYVDGGTLLDWSRARPRSTDEVLGLFLQAGQGLAAAHASGVAHCDFKPENVLVGSDGRARVTDFGLARSDDDLPGRPGAGTPAYVAPEVVRGRVQDARADQYSFCVALHELLAGGRPSGGEVSKALEGPVRAALQRGLSTEPERRFASMNALLAALVPKPRRVPWVALGAIAPLLALAASLLRQEAPLCTGAALKAATAWSAPRRAQLETAFAKAAPALAHVEKTLDGYAAAWARMHGDACEATRLRGEQSEQVLDLRMTCLQQRLQELDAAADLLSTADAQLIEMSARVVEGLSPLSACADVAALSSPLQPPAALRAEAEQVRGELARAKALELAGRYDDGLSLARPALARAKAARFGPLEAEAWLQLGRLEMLARHDAQAESALEEAFFAAQGARHDEVGALAAAHLVGFIAHDLDRRAEGKRWARLSRALLSRLHGAFETEAVLETNLGIIAADDNEADASLERLRHALALREQSAAPDASAIASSRANLGRAYSRVGKWEEARAELYRALAEDEAVLGPDHPEVAGHHNGLANVLADEGRHEEALAEFRRSLAIYERTSLDAKHPDLARAHSNIGWELADLHRYEESLAEYRAALALQLQVLPPHDTDVLSSRDGIATALSELGRHEEALAEYREVLAQRTATAGADDPETATSLVNLGEVFMAMGRFDDAVEHVQKGLTVIDAKASVRLQAQARFVLAKALWGAGRKPQAVAEGKKARTTCAEAPRCQQALPDMDAWLTGK